ncbi:cuticle protein 18.7-like isoform X2 [Diprion similis]|uniref:cuticle protein 18.7-like isoform X2 n=1 Tax=Diprion similis TaxID=362088 RepID=UPI001EF8C5B1|nr:cuticle protein 18.7-like isoform X2 [Diprion similis]
MNPLIVFSFLFAVAQAGNLGLPLAYGGYYGVAAPLAADGRVVDTPEVAHAKAVHFAEYAKAAAAAAAPGHAYGPAPAAYSGYGYGHAAAPLAADGRVVDTPEVAHAKAAHFAEYARAASAAAAPAPGHYGYAAAPAAYGHGYGYAAPLGHDGRVVETPEVAQAKAAHLAAHAAAAAQAHAW